jgi:hypothetical protein
LLLGLPACSYSIVRDGEINQPAASRIERELAVLRGLDFVAPVPMEVKSTEELRGYLEQQLERQYSPEQIHGLQRIYERLGLLPPTIDLGEALLKLYTSQIAGFYDPHAGKLFLVPTGVPAQGWMMGFLQFVLRRDLVNEMLLAHELTHALQDQHFGALAMADDPADDDRALAVHAVAEGDATLAGFAYVFGGLPEDTLMELVDRLDAVPAEFAAALPDTPAVLRDSLVFQYSAGARFVALAYRRAGWSGVNALLTHPPTSTEQILWPERYFARPDSPTEVHLGGLDDYRSSDEWSVVEENTLGALTVRILAERFLDPSRAEQIARGWDGDRLLAFDRSGVLHLYWMTIWDSEGDARRFFTGESEILAAQYPSSPRKSESERVSAGGETPYWLERHGNKVLVALGVPPREAAKRIETVWAKTTFVPVQIHLDLDLAHSAANSTAPTRLARPSRSSLSRWARTDFSATACSAGCTSR